MTLRMTRKMLLGIKRRAEQAGMPSAPTSEQTSAEKPLKEGSQVSAPA